MIKTKSTDEEDKHLLEAAFYGKPFQFSYSSLSRLLLSPNIFYKEYVLQQKEISTAKHLLEGTLIHFLLLEGNHFNDRFVVTPENLPSDNSILVANAIFEIYEVRVKENTDLRDLVLSDFPTEIDLVLTEMNLHQSVKDQDKRLAKILEPKTEAYFEYLKVRDTKDVIDSTMLDRATLAVEKIKSNEKICELLGMTREPDGNTFGVYNEIALSTTLPDFPFGLKGIVDNITIDVEKKQININDFKTSGKSLLEFADTVEYWKYWLQSVIYNKLAAEFFKGVINDDPAWKIDFRFIVFDKYDQLYAYRVSAETLALWTERCETALIAARYHYDSKDFTLPYDFAVGNVEL